MNNGYYHSQYDEQLTDCPYFTPNSYVDTEEQAQLYMSIDTGDLPRTQELVLRDTVPPIIDQNVLCAFYTADHDMAMPCMQVIFDAIDKRGAWPIREAFRAHARSHFFCADNLGSTGEHVFHHLTQDDPMTDAEEQVLLTRLFHYGHRESAVNLLQHLFERHPCTEQRIRYFLDRSAAQLRADHFARYRQMGLDLSLLDPNLKKKVQAPFESGLINEIVGKVCAADERVVGTYRQRAEKLLSLLREGKTR